jgi:hypothetical protein
MKSNSTTRWRWEFRRALFGGGLRILVAAFLLAAGIRAWGADPLVNLSQTRLNFLPQAAGTTSAPLLVVLSNSGQADLSISGITITGENKGDFAQTSNCPIEPAKLIPLGHCEIHVTFKPAVRENAGTLTAILNVSDNGSESPQTVNLTGISTASVPMISFSPASVAFGNQAQGTTSAVQVIVVSNTGSAILHVNSEVSISGSASNEFHIRTLRNSCPTGTWVLAPNASCDIGVVFAPETIGVKSAQIVMVDDANGSPQSIEMSATGN